MTPAILDIAIAAIDGTGDPVLSHVAFPAPTAVSVVDVADALLSGDLVAAALAVEYSADNATWTRLGGALALGGGLLSRRFAAAPGAAATAAYWRLVLADAAACDGRSLAIASVIFRLEGVTLSAARVAPHFVGDADAYGHIISDQTADVYARGAWSASIALPHTSDILGRIDWARGLDTMLVFHEKVPPFRLFRRGAATEWDGRAQDFTNVPLVEFSDTTYANGVDEVQQISFTGFANGDTFALTVDGESTGTIVYSTTAATTAANIKAAIEALDALGGGTVDVANTAGSVYSVTFRGGAGQANWPEMTATFVASTSGVVSTATLTEGKKGGEAIMSAARGWPRTGIFWQQRLILGGFLGQPQTGLASVLGDYFNFSAAGRRATDAVQFTVDANDASGIRQIIAVRYLQIFTADGEFHVTGDTLKGNDVNPVVQDHQNGIQAALRPEVLDGATVYVQNGGRAVRELSFADTSAGYVSSNISVRAPFLISAPIDAFAQRGGFIFECDRYHLIRNDGQLALFSSLRGQDFAAWCRYATSGAILAGGAEENGGPAYVVVQREINGQPVRYVEGFDPGRLLDCSILVDVAADATSIAGLAHLEGRSDVWAIDHSGYWFGPLSVTAGVATLPQPAPEGTYEVGLWFDAWADTMPFRLDAQQGSIADRRKRVSAATVSLINSAPPEVVYLNRAYRLPGQRFGSQILDVAPMRALTTGRLRVANMQGWTIDATVRVRRRAPGPLHIRALQLEVSF